MHSPVLEGRVSPAGKDPSSVGSASSPNTWGMSRRTVDTMASLNLSSCSDSVTSKTLLVGPAEEFSVSIAIMQVLALTTWCEYCMV